MKTLLFTCCLLVLPTLAATVDELPAEPVSFEKTKSFTEIGFLIGSPAALNVSLGRWWKPGIVTRVSAGTVIYLSGVEFDLGFAFDQTGNTKQFIGLTAGLGRAASIFESSDFSYLALSYGLKNHGTFVKAGPGVVASTNTFSFFTTSVSQSTDFMFVLQAGWTHNLF